MIFEVMNVFSSMCTNVCNQICTHGLVLVLASKDDTSKLRPSKPFRDTAMTQIIDTYRKLIGEREYKKATISLSPPRRSHSLQAQALP